MLAKKQFFQFWRSRSNLLSVSLYSVFLVVVEEFLELEFRCPQQEGLKHFYVFSYFFCPACIMFILSLTSHPSGICRSSCSWSRFWEVISKLILPPVICCVILTCDGRYIDCAWSRRGETRSLSSNQSRAEEPPSLAYTISQLLGLFVLTGLSLLYASSRGCPCCCCWGDEEGHLRQELEGLLEQEAWKHLEEMKKVGAEQIMEEKIRPLLLPKEANFWREKRLRGIARNVKDVVEAAVKDTWAGSPGADELREILISSRDVGAGGPPPKGDTSI